MYVEHQIDVTHKYSLTIERERERESEEYSSILVDVDKRTERNRDITIFQACNLTHMDTKYKKKKICTIISMFNLMITSYWYVMKKVKLQSNI